MSDKRPTYKQIADHLFMSTENFRVLRKRVTFPEGCSLDEAREIYIRHIRETASNRGGDDVTRPTLTALKVELEKQKVLKLEMFNKRYKGELLDAKEVELHWNKTLMTLRTKVLEVPHKLTTLLVGITDKAEIKELLTIAMNETLQDLADFNPEEYEKEITEEELQDDNTEASKETITHEDT